MLRVGVAFRQYNKNKPAKYGLLFCSINSAEIPYTYSSTLYAGKPPGEPNEHYLTSTDDIIKHLCDRFYTSINIANWLLEKKMTVVGTIKTNRKGVGDLKKMDGREFQTTEVYWEKEKGAMTMTSYVVNTKSSGKRNMLVIPTANPILGATKMTGKASQQLSSSWTTQREAQISWIKRWGNTR